MINKIETYHPTVVEPNLPVEHIDKFQYDTHGTISFNGREPIKIETESLLRLEKELSIIADNYK